MSLSALTIVAVETSEPAVNPYVVGAIVLALLLGLLLALVSFGGGREHT